jgi:hypothetical protein
MTQHLLPPNYYPLHQYYYDMTHGASHPNHQANANVALQFAHLGQRAETEDGQAGDRNEQRRHAGERPLTRAMMCVDQIRVR